MQFTKIFEETSAGDIAGHTPKLGLSRKGEGKACKCCKRLLGEADDCQTLINSLEKFQGKAKSKRLIAAIDELLDLLDTDC